MRAQPLPKIDWHTVESSNICALYWDDYTQTVCVRYKGPSYFSFIGVTKVQFENLCNAPSVDKYLNHVVKAFPYTRWDDEPHLLAHLNH